MGSPKPPRDADQESTAGAASRSRMSDDAPVAPAGTPRWVKVSAIVAVVVVLLVVVMLLLGGGPGGHGPQRHLGADAAARRTPANQPSGRAGPSEAGEPSWRHTGPPPGVEHDP